MPTKSVRFEFTAFPPQVVRQVIQEMGVRALREPWGFEDEKPTDPLAVVRAQYMKVTSGTTAWNLDNLDEYLAEIRRPHDHAYVRLDAWMSGCEVIMDEMYGTTQVAVSHRERAEIERIMGIFEDAAEQYRVIPELGPAPSPRVFIGHGRSPAWRELSDFLHHQMGYAVEAFETLPRAGHDIVSVLKDMLARTDFALLVMTAEDEQATGEVRARQNVIHEIGLWQGRIGWDRTLVLLEHGAEDFSNIAGVQQLRFADGQISSIYGDIVATLRREFGV